MSKRRCKERMDSEFSRSFPWMGCRHPWGWEEAVSGLHASMGEWLRAVLGRERRRKCRN